MKRCRFDPRTSSLFALALIACGGKSALVDLGDEDAVATGATGGSSGGSGGIAITGGTGGISITGGTGGGTGGSVMGPSCPSSWQLDTEVPLIADYECLEPSLDYGWFPIHNWPHGGYAYYNDVPESWQNFDPNDVSWEGGVGAPGHESASAFYVRMTKPAENWGTGFGVWMSTTECIDADVFTGVRFWAKGYSTDSIVSVSIGTAETVEPPLGWCRADECLPYSTDIFLSPDWSLYELSWSDFQQPMSPVVGPLNPGMLAGAINFHINTFYEQETIELWVDDLQFVGAVVEMQRSCGL